MGMPEQRIQMRRVFRTSSLVIFGLSYMVPLGIFTTYGQVTVLTHGHLPVAYIITLIAILFTALSYCKMSNVLPLSGSAYSYVHRTFGGNIGFFVGWAQILDYLFLPILNFLVLGLYLNVAFPSIPSAVFILVSLFIVTTLNILGIRLINSVNFIIIAGQFIFIGIFILLAFSKANLSPGALLKPLLFNQGDIKGLLSGAAILCLTFLGFDAIATMAEESSNAKNTIPAAIMLTVIIAGIIFLFISYAAHILYPDWQKLIPVQDTASVVISEKAGGKWIYIFFMATYLTGTFASAMTAQTSISRILYAMGREGVLPRKIFYHLHQRFHTPYLSILIVSTISLTALFLKLSLVVSMISFGALGAFTFVNLSVIKHFLVNQKCRGMYEFFHYGLLPFIGVILTFWLWASLDHKAIMTGLVWMAVGIMYLALLTRGFRKMPPSAAHDEIDKIIK